LTLGGTIGFEALVNKIPVINFGSVFYDSFEGVINCKSYLELYNILRSEYKIKQDFDLIEFTAKIIKLSKTGNPHPNKNLTETNNINNIVMSIQSELKI
jgi:capsule polysaccharide export protein KpsC/LpsZ